ncbi:sugar transporter domain-containing protein [Sarocladium implicatum]|nr:sugar transporter domain-containing protein [Sarocladium implicatum]
MWKPRINPYFTLTVVIIACGSIPKGYDEGGFAGATGLPSFQLDFGLTEDQWTGSAAALASRKANISSFGVLGAAFGAVLALCITDKFGRLRTWQALSLLWMSGFFMVTFSSGITGLMYFARLWGGLGAGGLTVCTPIYLSEIAPTRIRGMVVSIYMVVLLTFLMLGFFISYAAGKTMPPTRSQYQVVTAVPLIPVGLAVLVSFFLKDTPRWLVSKGRTDDALEALSKLRNMPQSSPEVQAEFSEIHEQIHATEQTLAGTSILTIIREVATIRSYRVRFLLGVAMQTIAQWTGGNGITYWVPTIFELAGVESSNQSLITSGAYGAVKLVFTMVFTWGLVDVFGRRVCFMTGLFLQCITHVYMAIYFGIWVDSENKSASDAAIASVFVYAVGWSIGLCTVQYLYGIEIYPTRIRGFCYATSMCLHWLFQFAVVRVTPNMFESLDVWGAYVFWACICAIGMVLLGLMAPETKGIPMERMHELFEHPWYMLWKAKVTSLPETSSTHSMTREESLRDEKPRRIAVES